MKKGKAVPIEKVNPIFDKLEQLSKVQRVAIWAGLLILLIVAFVYFSYLPKLVFFRRRFGAGMPDGR